MRAVIGCVAVVATAALVCGCAASRPQAGAAAPGLGWRSCRRPPAAASDWAPNIAPIRPDRRQRVRTRMGHWSRGLNNLVRSGGDAGPASVGWRMPSDAEAAAGPPGAGRCPPGDGIGQGMRGRRVAAAPDPDGISHGEVHPEAPAQPPPP